MDTIYVLNRMYSAVNVYIVGPDGRMGKLCALPGGASGKFINCPPWEFVISAFAVSNNSLQHLGKVRPSLAVYELMPNQHQEQVSVNDIDFSDEIASSYGSETV